MIGALARRRPPDTVPLPTEDAMNVFLRGLSFQPSLATTAALEWGLMAITIIAVLIAALS